MIRYIIYSILVLVIFTSCNSYRSQVKSFSPQCQQLLQELSYRMIKNDTGGYTFRFEYPVSDTIPKSATLRHLEYQNFNKTVLGNDSLCECGFTYDLIAIIIGKENKNDKRFLNRQQLYSSGFLLYSSFYVELSTFLSSLTSTN